MKNKTLLNQPRTSMPRIAGYDGLILVRTRFDGLRSRIGEGLNWLQ
jgi:hypothetical protein